MSGAVLAGLTCTTCENVFVVCVNDLIADEDYARLQYADADLLIPTIPLQATFVGGMLQLGEGHAVRAIVEKPPGGCPPASAANIMIHRWSGRENIRTLCNRLRAGEEYEAAVTAMIAGGLRAFAVPVKYWAAIKTPADYELEVSRMPDAVRDTA